MRVTKWFLLKQMVDIESRQIRGKIRTEDKAIKRNEGDAHHQENLYGQLVTINRLKQIIKAIEERKGKGVTK